MITAQHRRTLAIAALTAIVALLHLCGSVVGSPPLDAGLWVGWWLDTDPIVAVAATLRLGALVVGVWLLGATLIDTLAVAVRAHLLQRLAAALVPAAWRTLVLRPALVVALAAPPIIVPFSNAHPVSAQVVEPDGTDDPVVLTMSLHGPATPVLATGAAEGRTITMSVHGPVDTGPDLEVERRTHVVAPGENLWSIAAAYLNAERGERPSPDEVTPYWHALIDTNRSVLPDPENPDLLYRGIELTMPPLDRPAT